MIVCVIAFGFLPFPELYKFANNKSAKKSEEAI